MKFIEEFYFLIDIESRFNLLKKHFGLYEHNHFKKFTIRKNFLLEEGIQMFKEFL